MAKKINGQNEEQIARDWQQFGDRRLEVIKFGESAFKKGEANANLQFKQEFNGDVYKWNALTETLDRYDPFSELLIDSDVYREKAFDKNGKEKSSVSDGDIRYGIRYDEEIHDNGVILEHQRRSTEDFLKRLRGFGLLADVVGSGKTFEAGLVLSELAIRGYISSMLIVVPEDVYEDWIMALEKCFGLGRCVKNAKGKPVKQADREPAVLVQVGAKLDGKLFEKKDKTTDYLTPISPLIVKMEDFVQWKEVDVANKLFDVIVVDEAHHLNSSEGKEARAMMLLSTLMETKQKAKKTYCLLLSATPHAGNLEDMFRLWYFIRCQGGTPQDFDPTKGEKDKTARYTKEREFYLKEICRGANTVKDFVRKEKISIVRGGSASFCVRFLKYVAQNYKEGSRSKHLSELSEQEKIRATEDFVGELLEERYCDKEAVCKYILAQTGRAENEETKKIRDAFERYLQAKAETVEEDKQNRYADFDYSYDGNKERIIDEFLNASAKEFRNLGLEDVAKYADGGAMRARVELMIADIYHNVILRSIMIRQPDKQVKRTGKSKKVVNVMLFRTNEKPKKEIKLDFLEETAVVSINPKKFDYLGEEKVIRRERNGKAVTDGFGADVLRYSFDSYIEERKDEGSTISYGLFFSKFMEQFGVDENHCVFNKKEANYPYQFHRQDSVAFYEEQIDAINQADELSRVYYNFLPVYDSEIAEIDKQIDLEDMDDEALDKRRWFFLKYKRLTEILARHDKERVIVFFDYLLGSEESVHTTVLRMLLSDKKFKDRVIDVQEFEGEKANKRSLTETFNQKSDAILVVTNKKLTEGTNLQACNIIVNFQITSDPLAMQQSIGRVFRIGQKNDVTVYSIADMYKLEGYLLAYYTRIGLMSSDTGDAEILAGCNDADMVTLLCPNPSCQHLGLYTKEDCEQLTRYELNAQGLSSSNRYMVRCSECQSDKYMLPLITSNVRCDKCDAAVIRTIKEDGVPTYSCVRGGETLSTTADGQTYYCNKYCAMTHCKKLAKWGCKAIEMYRRVKRPATEIKAETCNFCKHLSECQKAGCIYEIGPDAILKCQTCSENSCRKIKPHVLEFNSAWEAKCPACKDGTLRPESEKSFSTYINKLYTDSAMDEGGSFCRRFQEEIEKVVEIKRILRADKSRDE